MRGELSIRGGTVVSAEGAYGANVLIKDGRVVAVGEDDLPRTDQTLDATGCVLLPGGVDAHTHFDNPALDFKTRSVDDFSSGTLAAAMGGTTTILDFVKTRPGEPLWEAFTERRAAAAAQVFVDFALHPIIPSDTRRTGALEDLKWLAREGVRSCKFFMAYPGSLMVDDGTLLEGMRACADLGILPMVHAENGHMVADATERLLADGKGAAHHHHDAHTHGAEAEAVNRAIALSDAAGAPLFVVHVSSRHAAEVLGTARAAGRRVWGETCPQYLLVAYEDYASLGDDAAKYVCSPPIRERANQDHLWQALRTGALSTVGTDHAPFCAKQSEDLPPQKPHGAGNFTRIPNGVPGVEERLLVLYEHGVVGGRLPLSRFVDVIATRPAKLFGLYPRKGAIEPGADADIVIWDPERAVTIRAADMHSRVDYSLYEGMSVSGSPRHVLARGELIVSDGQICADAGRGSYVHRNPPVLT
jgi:dihydropyrimidinase